MINEDLSEASVILGVKQVPVKSLIADKTYVFFSHTIKAQAENMEMLDAILEKVSMFPFNRFTLIVDRCLLTLLLFVKHPQVCDY